MQRYVPGILPDDHMTDGMKLFVQALEDPEHVGDAETSPDGALPVLEEAPPAQAEEQAPAPATPADPKEDDAKSVSSASSDHIVRPLSDVAKGKRKCVDFTPWEEEMPQTPFNFSHQRSFPLVRNSSLSSLFACPPERTKMPVPILGYEEGEPSRPPRSVLQALGLTEAEWDDSVVPSPLPPELPSKPVRVVPKTVRRVRKPVVVLPIPVGEVTDHVYDLPKRASTLPRSVRRPPTMSGALPVPAGWRPEPNDTPQAAKVPKVKWRSLLIRKLRNAMLPKPILRLLLGKEIANQTKSALELRARGGA